MKLGRGKDTQTEEQGYAKKKKKKWWQVWHYQGIKRMTVCLNLKDQADMWCEMRGKEVER